MGRARHGLAILVALVAAGLVAGCTGSSAGAGPDDPVETTTAAPVTMTYATDQQFNSYNNNPADTASVGNSLVLNQVLRGFWFAAPDGTIKPDTEFGTYTRVSANPLTVRYTFDPKARWSDGNPLDCDDAVLAWAANSGRWPTGAKDPDTGRKLTAFSSIRPGEWSNVEAPECKEGDTSFTVTYDTVFADWQSLFGPGTILPAHVVEKQAGVLDVVDAVRENDKKLMIELGRTWNTLWLGRPGEFKTALSPSSGPYQVKQWKAGESVTLEPNDAWWGTPPRAATVILKYTRPDELVDAIRSGEAQVITPTPSEEVSAQLEGSTPLTIAPHDSFSFEHLDFNFRKAFKNADLRKAFATCVPRQEIVDTLVKPQNPSAKILESRFLLPFQPGYAQVAGSGGAAYDEADVAAAKKILQSAKKVGTKVRIGYQTPNPRRKAEVALIKKSCDAAGFKVTDGGDPAFLSGALLRGDFDVALFAWNGSSRITQAYTTYISKGSENHGNYRSQDVDTLLRQLYSELNPTRQRELMAQLDAKLWKDVATVPLFAYPGLLVTTPDVKGVQYNPNPQGVTFNLNTWTRGS